jgi:hypothetical protein
MQQNYFSTALSFFKKENYQCAFDCLQKLSVKEATRLLLSFKKSNTKHFSNPAFWTELVSVSNSMPGLFETVYAPKIFYYYWSNFPFSGLSLFQYLLKNKPELLIQSLRQNEVFLSDEKWEKLHFEFYTDQAVSNHLLFIEILRKGSKVVQNKIKTFEEKLIQLRYPELIVLAGAWFNRLVLSQPGDISGSKSYDSVCALSECLSYYRSITSGKQEHDDQFKEPIFQAMLFDEPEEFYDKNIGWFSNLMALFIHNEKFTKDVIHSYCYDKSFDVRMADRSIQLFCSNPELFKLWKLSGGKLEYFQYRLNTAAEEIFVFERNKLPAEKNDLYIEIAWKEYFKTELLADYYSVGKMDRDFLLGINTVVNGFRANGIKDNENFLRNETAISLTGIINKVVKEPGQTDKSLTFLSTDVKLEDTNLFLKPFLLHEGNYYILTEVLACNNTPVSLINAWLLSNKENAKEEVGSMEERLSNLLNKIGFVSFNSINYNNQKGSSTEFDIIALYKETILLIEMKRTRISDTLKDNHLDFSNNVLSAAMQLYRNEQVILNNPAFLNEQFSLKGNSLPQNLKIEKWIVSQSFEHDHEIIDGCLKISLFELEEVIEEICTNSIAEKETPYLLIERIRKNVYWQDKPIDDNMTPDFPSVFSEISVK